MSRLTTSKLELAARCLWWLRPSAGAGNGEGMEAAQAGSAEHGYIEATLATGDTEAKSPIHQRWLDDWHARWGDGPWMAEVAMAMDPVTRRVMRGPGVCEGTDRYPWAPAGWVPGSADAIQLLVDGVPVTEAELEARRAGAAEIQVRVIDWKSGFRARDFLTPTHSNLQLLWLGAMACELYGADAARIEIVFCRADGVWADTHDIDAMGLRDMRGVVADMLRRLRDGDEGELEARRGAWCSDKFCPAHGRCPATRGDLARVSPQEARRVKIPTFAHEIENMAHASEVYHILRAAKARMEEVWGALRGWVDELGPLPVAPGVAWGRRLVAARETIDLGEPAEGEQLPPGIRALEAVAGPAWPLAVGFKGSKQRLRAAARAMVAAEKAAGRKATIAAMEARLLDALRHGGFVKTSVGTKVEEFAVTPALLAEYPYLLAAPHGSKVIERIEDDGADDGAETQGESE